MIFEGLLLKVISKGEGTKGEGGGETVVGM